MPANSLTTSGRSVPRNECRGSHTAIHYSTNTSVARMNHACTVAFPNDAEAEAAVNQRWIRATAVIIAVAVALSALYYLVASF